jgi:hypothetical protein
LLGEVIHALKISVDAVLVAHAEKPEPFIRLLEDYGSAHFPTSLIVTLIFRIRMDEKIVFQIADQLAVGCFLVQCFLLVIRPVRIVG